LSFPSMRDDRVCEGLAQERTARRGPRPRSIRQHEPCGSSVTRNAPGSRQARVFCAPPPGGLIHDVREICRPRSRSAQPHRARPEQISNTRGLRGKAHHGPASLCRAWRIPLRTHSWAFRGAGSRPMMSTASELVRHLPIGHPDIRGGRALGLPALRKSSWARLGGGSMLQLPKFRVATIRASSTISSTVAAGRRQNPAGRGLMEVQIASFCAPFPPTAVKAPTLPVDRL